jgi:protein-tyrosine phosphatase
MDTWWIDKPRLLGSRNPTTADLEQLRSDGFTVLVSLLREEEQAPNYDLARAQALGFERHNVPVRDFCPPTLAQLWEFVELMERLPLETKVFVHCEGGTGRTGTFAAAYWIAKGMPMADAIAYVRKLRPHAVETREQEAVLEQFAREQHSSASQGAGVP